MIIYKVSWLSWLCLRIIIRIPYIGLVNIVAGKRIIEEFIQYNARPKRIVNYIVETLNNPGKIASIKNELSQVKLLLGEKGASKRAAKIVLDVLAQV